MAVARYLPRNVNILQTFDDNVLLKRHRLFGFGVYPNSKFSFDYMLVLINQLGQEETAVLESSLVFFFVCMSYYQLGLPN